MNVVCLKILYKFNAFSILTKHLPHAVAVIFSVWGMTAKLAGIPFAFFPILQIEDTFLAFNLSIWLIFSPC